MSDWFWSYGFADVREDLLVGAYPLDASDIDVLQRLGIRHVLNLVEDDEYEPGQQSEVETALAAAGIQESRLSLVDYGHLPPDALEEAVQTVTGWLDAGERTYVHCRAGWQRSAAVAAAVLAARDGFEIGEALEVVQVRKPSANPLEHQRADLARWYSERG